MRRIIDLTMPIAKHVRWPVERKLLGDLAKGDAFHSRWTCLATRRMSFIRDPRYQRNGMRVRRARDHPSHGSVEQVSIRRSVQPGPSVGSPDFDPEFHSNND